MVRDTHISQALPQRKNSSRRLLHHGRQWEGSPDSGEDSLPCGKGLQRNICNYFTLSKDNFYSTNNMSSLPNEILYNISNFLPNDDITDLMLMSRNFNALVTLRLKKIDQEMATMNQSIKSNVPGSPESVWISQLNLKRYEPIGSKAKKRMNDVIEILPRTNQSGFEILDWKADLLIFKERMSLERLSCHVCHVKGQHSSRRSDPGV
ncbi:hypothetical protein DdX_16387 [Ditylenchus destructor]|uniref:F-box domain-containing protein n=1 Tax=Ditylenchus destructor TaxID=166010 RepID=A0AAD4MTL6_9BILA|nr:hypothetical protein DdX_16387 [Ditylenchus destructor]